MTGIESAAQSCPSVINLSFGGTEPSEPLRLAILKAVHNGNPAREPDRLTRGQRDKLTNGLRVSVLGNLKHGEFGSVEIWPCPTPRIWDGPAAPDSDNIIRLTECSSWSHGDAPSRSLSSAAASTPRDSSVVTAFKLK